MRRMRRAYKLAIISRTHYLFGDQMKTSQAGIDLIKSFESCSLVAYPDPGTGGEPWTIGWGHTGRIKPGDTVTAAEADDILENDLHSAEHCIEDNVRVPLNANEHAALVSFVFNCGCTAFRDSTLLKKLNGHDYAGAALEFRRWDKSNNKVMAGLTRRRIAEEQLFKEEA